MTEKSLRFPSGRTVEQVKKDASKLSKDQSITYTQALDQLAVENGGEGNWQKSINVLNATGGYVRLCEYCELTGSSANPLIPVLDGDHERTGEYVHITCVSRSGDYGFCWCCGEQHAFPVGALNAQAECPQHDGESQSDYLDDDIDSLAENIQNNSSS